MSLEGKGVLITSNIGLYAAELSRACLVNGANVIVAYKPGSVDDCPPELQAIIDEENPNFALKQVATSQELSELIGELTTCGSEATEPALCNVSIIIINPSNFSSTCGGTESEDSHLDELIRASMFAKVYAQKWSKSSCDSKPYVILKLSPVPPPPVPDSSVKGLDIRFSKLLMSMLSKYIGDVHSKVRCNVINVAPTGESGVGTVVSFLASDEGEFIQGQEI